MITIELSLGNKYKVLFLGKNKIKKDEFTLESYRNRDHSVELKK